MIQKEALSLLRRALNNSTAEFRDGQWEAIAAITEHQSRLLVVQRTGWGKSCLLYTSPSPRDISGSRMPSSA